MSRSGSTTRDRARAEGAETQRGPASGARPARTPSTPRPRRRRALSRRRRWVLRAGLALLAVGLVAWVLLASPLLAVRRVQVDGAQTLTAAQIRRAAGVSEGIPLLRVDVDAARARVARLPQVASVQVTRGWPATVVVTVVERAPVAVVESEGTRTLVDRDGVLFDAITGDPPKGVVPLDVAQPGPDDAATRAALAALVALPPSVRADVQHAVATTDRDITLTVARPESKQPTTVLWGDGGDAARKASALGALLDQMRSGALAPAGTIDVSVPKAVVLR